MINKQAEKVGVIIGGSGLIGGATGYYFRKICNCNVQILAPNSKSLSLRNPKDIRDYLRYYQPDFIINSAIAAIDSDPKMAYEINYLGSVNLAKAAIALNIPYIFISSAAVLPNGWDISEEQVLSLSPELTNYAKSKLMCEKTLRYLAENEGLDYTVIRLAVVYGKHDHKIQGFHRMLFSVADQSMPLLFTQKNTCHSYTNARKIPYFIDHALNNRQEFSGQVYNFVDPNPVSLAQLILTVRSFLELKKPHDFYLPLPFANMGAGFMKKLLRMLNRIGIEARMPAELMFLENFYQSQVLSSKKMANSSFQDPFPAETVFTRLPEIIEYYLTRWEHLNLISEFNQDYFDPQHLTDEFLSSPTTLLNKYHQSELSLFSNFNDIKKDHKGT